MMGQTSFDLLWLWFAGAFVLGIAIAFGMMKAGYLRRSERQTLDRNTEALQRREDPHKRPL